LIERRAILAAKTLAIVFSSPSSTKHNNIAAAEAAAKAIYSIWPVNAVNQIKQVALATAADIVVQQLPVFYSGTANTFNALARVLVQGDGIAELNRPIGSDLDKAIQKEKMFVATLPCEIRESLDNAAVVYQYANVQTVCSLLRGKTFAPAVARDVLMFVMHADRPRKSDYAALDGMKVIPLLDGKLGFAKLKAGVSASVGSSKTPKSAAGKRGGSGAKGGAKSSSSRKAGLAADDVATFYTFKDAQLVVAAFPNCPGLVSAPDDIIYQKLASPHCHAVLNITQLTSSELPAIMPYCLPISWIGRQCVQTKDCAEITGGTDADRLGGAIGGSGVGGGGGGGGGGAKLTKSEAKAATKKHKKGSEGVKKHSNHHQTGSVTDDLKSEDAEIRLTALWSIINGFERNESPPEDALGDWPIVHTSEGFCCTVSYARKRIVLHSPWFSADEIGTLRSFGCLFLSGTAHIEAAKLTNVWLASCIPTFSRGDAVAAVAATIRATPDTPIDASRCQELRKLVLVWDRERRTAPTRGDDLVQNNNRSSEAFNVTETDEGLLADHDEFDDTDGADCAGTADACVGDGSIPNGAYASTNPQHAATDRFGPHTWTRSAGASAKPQQGVDRSVIRQLPIFQTYGALPSTSMSLNDFGLQPIEGVDSRLMCGPADLNTGVYAAESSWDDVLLATDGERLIKLLGEENQQLCRLAHATRPSIADFLQLYSVTRDSQLGVPALFVQKMLTACGVLLTTKQKGFALVSAAIKKLRIIEGPAGEPLLCSQCLDPTHRLLVDALTGWTGAVFPPLELQGDVTMRILRLSGLRTLKHPAVFVMAAEAAATRKDLAFSEALLRFLVAHWEEIGFATNTKMLIGLCAAEFIPVRNLSECVAPSETELGSPNFSASRLREIAGLYKEKAVLKSHRGKQGEAVNKCKQAYDLLEDEQVGALDFGELEVDGSQSKQVMVKQLTEKLLHDATTLAVQSVSLPLAAAVNHANGLCGPSSAGTVEFVAFEGQKLVCLAQDAWLAYSECLILPSFFNSAPQTFIKTLTIISPPPIAAIMRHLLYTSLRAEACASTLDAAQFLRLRAMMLAGLALVQEALHCGTISKKYAQQTLGSAPVIVTDDNELIRACDVCAELDVDIGADLRAIPEFMQDLYTILVAIGARTTASSKHVPKIKITEENASDNLLQKVQTSLNNPVFADVKMIVTDNTLGLRAIYCHRLVLGLTSEYFRTMFMAGLEESRRLDDDAHANMPDFSVASMELTSINVPEWATYDGVMGVLQYVYTGAADGGSVATFQPPDARKCELVRTFA
jgi:hypothetical protein